MITDYWKYTCTFATFYEQFTMSKIYILPRIPSGNIEFSFNALLIFIRFQKSAFSQLLPQTDGTLLDGSNDIFNFRYIIPLETLHTKFGKNRLCSFLVDVYRRHITYIRWISTTDAHQLPKVDLVIHRVTYNS